MGSFSPMDFSEEVKFGFDFDFWDCSFVTKSFAERTFIRRYKVILLNKSWVIWYFKGNSVINNNLNIIIMEYPE